MGLVSFGVAVLLATLISALGAPRGWRLTLLVPLWIGALGIFQALDKTRIRLAARGRRDMDTGGEPITDPVELARVRSQARRVHVKSLLLSIVVTAIVILI